MTPNEYEAKYPGYCRTCKGIGGHKGRSVALPIECPDCYGSGMCGRCAADYPKDRKACPCCGWRPFNPDDAMPGGNYV